RGYRVVVTDIDEEAAAKTARSLVTKDGVEHASARLNVTDAAEAAAVADRVADTYSLDAWVSNAGISFMQKFLEIPIEQYDRTLEINLKGVFVSGQAAARAMVRTGRAGRIVNTASM